jgi:hypothetical protein
MLITFVILLVVHTEAAEEDAQQRHDVCGMV